VTKVFVAEGSTAKVVEVEVGTREKEWVEVRSLKSSSLKSQVEDRVALGTDAQVITSGQTQLVEGSAIRIR
jgi:hypothetical protein